VNSPASVLDSAPGICTMERLASPISTRAAITATASLHREDDAGTVLGIVSILPFLKFCVGCQFSGNRLGYSRLPRIVFRGSALQRFANLAHF